MSLQSEIEMNEKSENQSIQEERCKITTYFQDAQENQKYNLMRGGCVIKTKIGPIQFGMPPETVKDSINLS